MYEANNNIKYNTRKKRMGILRKTIEKKLIEKQKELYAAYQKLAEKDSDSMLLERRKKFIEKGDNIGLEIFEAELDKRGIHY